MKNICYIISAGDNTGTNFKKNENDYVIAVDGGYAVLKQLEIESDLTLGDFDSLGYVPKESNLIKLKCEKDDTDTAVAIKEAINLGYKDIVIFGGTGGRTDHTIANIQSMLMAAKKGVNISMIDKERTYKVIVNNSCSLEKKDNGYLSVFSLGDCAKGVSIMGAKYNLNDAILSNDNPLGVSNEFVGEEVTINVENGKLLIVYNN